MLNLPTDNTGGYYWYQLCVIQKTAIFCHPILSVDFIGRLSSSLDVFEHTVNMCRVCRICSCNGL